VKYITNLMPKKCLLDTGREKFGIFADVASLDDATFKYLSLRHAPVLKQFH